MYKGLGQNVYSYRPSRVPGYRDSGPFHPPEIPVLARVEVGP